MIKAFGNSHFPCICHMLNNVNILKKVMKKVNDYSDYSDLFEKIRKISTKSYQSKPFLRNLKKLNLKKVIF